MCWHKNGRFLRIHFWHGWQNRFQPRFDFSGFILQPAFVKFSDDARPRVAQARELPALREKFEPAFDRRHSQQSLSRKDSGAPGLQMKERGARSAARIRAAGDQFEEFGRASIFPFIEGEIGLPQDGRDSG